MTVCVRCMLTFAHYMDSACPASGKTPSVYFEAGAGFSNESALHYCRMPREVVKMSQFANHVSLLGGVTMH